MLNEVASFPCCAVAATEQKAFRLSVWNGRLNHNKVIEQDPIKCVVYLQYSDSVDFVVTH